MGVPTLLAVFTAILCSPILGQQPRTRLKMDFGWLFHFGVHDIYGNCTNDVNASFPVDLSGVQCLGLSQVSQATNEAECEQACCRSSDCRLYQWCASDASCSPQHSCWIGSGDCQNTGQTGWVGRGRNGPSAKIYDDKSWRKLNIPHDFVVEQPFSSRNEMSHGYLPKNQSWYRRHFSLDATYKDSVIWIDFDGVYRDSNMYLNGVFLGNHASGYTSFRYYLDNNLLEFGSTADNVLAVFLDPTKDEGWWYEGGGIYRHVWLNVANKVYFQPWGIYIPSTVTNINNDGSLTGDATMHINATIVNNGTSAVTVNAQFGIVDDSTNHVLTNLSMKNIAIGPNATNNFILHYDAKNIKLWDITSPSLYRVEAVITDTNNKMLDDKNEKFGFRKAVFDVNKGLFLNDISVKMKGFCNHQDFAGCGVAMPDRVNRFRVQHLQNMGTNSWRMSHNPPNPELLEFTDEYGILVWDENRNFANHSQYLLDQRDMILRDRNHPSIVIWSLCNENGCMEGNPKSGPVGELFIAVVRKYDGYQRPISAAFDHGWGDALSPLLDIQGVNYNYPELTTYHKQHPNQAVISSESCSCTTDRGEYVSNATSGHCSAYVGCPWNSYPCPQGCWIPIADNEFVAGSFDWTGFDYKGEPTPYKWPDINSHFGVNDMAGFPKDNYWYYRAVWKANEPLIYILPNTWNFAGTPTLQIWIYTNCEYVSLSLNNQIIGNQTVKVPHLDHPTYNVRYQPGVLTAKCLDNQFNVIQTYSIETTNAANKIKLEFEYPYNSSNTIYSDGQDVAMIKVSVLDDMNRLVPTATNRINFAVTGSGTIYGVGNGDPASHEPDKADYRSAWHGLARVIVQSQLGQNDQIKLTATSNGLTSDSISINVVTPPNPTPYLP